MDRWFGRYSDRLYAVMRLVAGVLFSCHGAQKLFGVLGGQSQIGNPKLFAAGIIEFGGGLLIALGLWAGYAAFIASGEMAFAYFTVHAGGGFWPIVNKGELTVLYCFLFLFIASRGSGVCSVERLMKKKAARRSGSEPDE
jgi:putative oxidoreductase